MRLLHDPNDPRGDYFFRKDNLDQHLGKLDQLDQPHARSQTRIYTRHALQSATASWLRLALAGVSPSLFDLCNKCNKARTFRQPRPRCLQQPPVAECRRWPARPSCLRACKYLAPSGHTGVLPAHRRCWPVMLLGIIHSISQYLFFITSTGEVKLLNNCVQDIIQTSLDRLHSTHSRYQFYMGSVARSDDPGFNESIQTLGRILSKRDLRSTARWGMELNTWDRPNGVAYILRATLRGATGCCSALRLHIPSQLQFRF